MTRLPRGVQLAVAHLLLVGSLGGKLLFDRAMAPRVWVRTVPVDPSNIFRGRYVQLRLALDDRRSAGDTPLDGGLRARLAAVGGQLVALSAEGDEGEFISRRTIGSSESLVLDRPVAYSIPERVADPSIRAPGEELWVEVTVPPRGLPRPIRLGVRKEGVLTPLTF